MGRIAFQLDLNIIELINVPLFDETKCYFNCNITNDKVSNFKRLHNGVNSNDQYKSVKNNKVKFGNAGKFKIKFNAHTSGNRNRDVEMLNSKWLNLSFMLKHNDDNMVLLGGTSINLIEYINEKTTKEVRFLLDKSKTNTIVKLTLLVNHLETDSDVTYGLADAKNGNGSCNISSKSPSTILNCATTSMTPMSNNSGKASALPNNQRSRATTGTSSVGSASSQMSPISSAHAMNRASTEDNLISFLRHKKSSSLNESLKSKDSRSKLKSTNMDSFYSKTSNPVTKGKFNKNLQVLMNEACDDAINENSLLDELINKTYRFSWQLKSFKYSEYTPIECVKDIIENNGNGWKKNEEGFDMIDVVESEFKDEQLSFNDTNYNNSYSNHRKASTTKFDQDMNAKTLFREFTMFSESDSDTDANDNDSFGYSTSSDDDSESGEFFNYYKPNKRKSKTKKFKPLTEAEVREDLRSWKVHF